MFNDVGQPFLGNTKQGRFHAGFQCRSGSLYLQGDFERILAIVELGHHEAQCRHQAHIIQLRRAQVVDQVAQFAQRGHRHVLQIG